MKRAQAVGGLIDRLDALLSAGRFQDALDQLVEILAGLHSLALTPGAGVDAPDPLAMDDANRLAAAIRQLAAAEDFQLHPDDFHRLAAVKRSITMVFELSEHRGALPAMQGLSSSRADGKREVGARLAAWMYLCLSANEMPPAVLETLQAQKPDVALPIILGMLGEELLWSPQATRNLTAIVEAWSDHRQGRVSSAALQTIATSYMGCSYIDAASKHDIKKLINRIVRNYLLLMGCRDIPDGKRSADRSRPKILIIAELYRSDHAMHRVYGPSIKALRERFELVLMTGTGQIDEALRPLFDEIDTTVFDTGNPRIFMQAAQAHRADMVYLPSVGMRPMSIFASNLRLAPIQFMTYGHPATTHSPYIDYGVVHHGILVDPDTVTERVFVRQPGVQFLDHPADMGRFSASEKRVESPEIRLAIPAWIRKLSPAFLATCKEIAQRSPRRVRFVFLPNCTGLAFHAARRRLTSLLPAIVLPHTDYPTYLANLARCDLYLSSFPFGGTNSVIDGFKAGLVPVVMTGREMHSMIDARLVQGAQLPDWLVCSTQEDYVRSALRLIEDAPLRNELSNQLRQTDLQALLFAEQPNEDFTDIVWHIYRHHESLQASTRRIWDHSDIAAAPPG